MKKTFFTSILMSMCLFTIAQNVVYGPEGKRHKYASEDLDLIFSARSDSPEFPAKPGEELAPVLLGMLPTALESVIGLTTKALENRAKKFTAEFTKQKSYLEAGKKKVPDFEVKKTVSFDNSSHDALDIVFKAHTVDKLAGFIYTVDAIELNYASAKVRKNKNTLDYTFEIKIVYLVDGEKKEQQLSPLSITSVSFGKNDYSSLGNKYRTDIIPLPEGGVLTEISVKIVESNPAKIRAEKILALWNDQKDNVKTIINNFLPKQKDTSEEESADGNTNSGNKPAP